MPDQLIIAITGPTGSGKSTIANLLATQTEKCVNIDADLVKHFIASDFRYEDPTGIDQWILLGRNIGMLANNFYKEGYNVIINGYLREQAWTELENYVKFTQRFLLMPEMEITQMRDAARHPNNQMGKEAVSDHYDFFSNYEYYSNFIRIDSSDQTKSETLTAIISKLGDVSI